jgi:hypothetical protein
MEKLKINDKPKYLRKLFLMVIKSELLSMFPIIKLINKRALKLINSPRYKWKGVSNQNI